VVRDEVDGLEAVVKRRSRGEHDVLGENSRVPDRGLMTGGEHRSILIKPEGRAGLPSDEGKRIRPGAKDRRHPPAWIWIEGRLGHHHLDRGFVVLSGERWSSASAFVAAGDP
jgi:hypothetical protein